MSLLLPFHCSSASRLICARAELISHQTPSIQDSTWMDVSHQDSVNNKIVPRVLHILERDLSEVSGFWSFCFISTTFANSTGKKMPLFAETEQSWLLYQQQFNCSLPFVQNYIHRAGFVKPSRKAPLKLTQHAARPASQLPHRHWLLRGQQMQLTEGKEDFTVDSSRSFALLCKALSTLYRSLQVIHTPQKGSTANYLPVGYS